MNGALCEMSKDFDLARFNELLQSLLGSKSIKASVTMFELRT